MTLFVGGSGLRLRVLTGLLAASVLAAGGCGGNNTEPSVAGKPTTAERSAGGEASIEGFGQEAGGTDRAALIATFRNYMRALAVEDAVAACSYLSQPVQRSLAGLSGNEPNIKVCRGGLLELLGPQAPSTAATQAKGEVVKVRTSGDRAFVIFHAPGATLFQQTMLREDDEWRLGTVVASVLVPSAATLGK